MAESTELAERQRRALDRLRPLADSLGLYLAGGTAVASHLGHRVSRDIDLFSREPDLDLTAVHAAMTALPGVEVVSMTDAALHVRLEGLPVDVVRYPYRPLQEPRSDPGQFPVASLEDLAVMKLSAIARRGIRRDFWDLYAIVASRALSLEQALRSYVRRYGVRQSDLYHVLRALTYFDDAEADALLPEGLSTEAWTEITAWFTSEVPTVLRQFIQP
jgi:hypothetical protein